MHLPTQRRQVVKWQNLAQNRRQRPDNCPVFARIARRERRRARQLHAPFGVHIGTGFFGVGRAGQDDIGGMRPDVAVVSLINNECLVQLALYPSRPHPANNTTSISPDAAPSRIAPVSRPSCRGQSPDPARRPARQPYAETLKPFQSAVTIPVLSAMDRADAKMASPSSRASAPCQGSASAVRHLFRISAKG